MMGRHFTVVSAKHAWKPLLRTVLDAAGTQWKNDFSMVLYEVEKQLEAKQRLDGR